MHQVKFFKIKYRHDRLPALLRNDAPALSQLIALALRLLYLGYCIVLEQP